MKRFPLNKSNKLCSQVAIEALFTKQPGTEALLNFPLRVVWRVNSSRKADTTTPKFFISVPKRRIRHAVDRVTLRRRIREAYRLNRNEYLDGVNLPIDMAIMYVADRDIPYGRIEQALRKLLNKIALKCSSTQSEES